MNTHELEQLAREYAQYQEFLALKEMHLKQPAANTTAQLVHGPTGLFSASGINPEVFSAMLQPRGLGAILPKFGSVMTNPQYAILTGQEDDNGTEPTDSCGDPVTTGFKKACQLTAQFGMLQRGTNTIDPSDIITRLNRGEFIDLFPVGEVQPTGETGFNPMRLDPQSILNNTVATELSGVATSFVRNLSQQLWTGTVAGATAGWAQFPGLDSQITTGHVDSVTNTTCPAVDSDVKDFAYDNVDGSDTRDIVEYLSMLEFFIVNNAMRIGFDAVEWVVVMRPELWQELTAIWPIAYNTNRGATVLGGNTRMIVDGGDMIAARDQMRRSLTIEINARNYRVVLDDGINEADGNTAGTGMVAGEFASDIYFVPLRVNGFAVTRLEYLDYRMVNAFMNALGQMGQSKVRFWTNDGIYLWVVRDHPGYCFDVIGRTQMRVVLQTPHLAGRIQNVKYAPLQHLRSPYPDSSYFADGGVSTRADLSNSYAVWNS